MQHQYRHLLSPVFEIELGVLQPRDADTMVTNENLEVTHYP